MCTHVLHRFMDVTNARAPGLGVCDLDYKISSLLSRYIVTVCLAHGISCSAIPQHDAPADQGAGGLSSVDLFFLSQVFTKSHHTAEPTWEPQAGAALAPGDQTHNPCWARDR